jgi:DNA ligase-associated metallophosphoesterase
MNIQDCTIRIHGEDLLPLPSGGLSWPTRRILCVSDLHLGKSDRIARRGGTLLPPYETRDTLARLEADIAVTAPQTVICLGDSFDDRMAADSLDDDEVMWINRLQAGRRWIWIEGNHDPGPMGLAGTHLAELHEGALHFRHIAQMEASGEISGHFHPKAEVSVRGRLVRRRCFLFDTSRVILPAYGTYTGGLPWTAPELRALMARDAMAALLGDPVRILPLP